MPQDISELETEVSEEVGIMQSATVLINGFRARLEDAGVDPAKLAALKADLDSNGNALAQAVADNSEPPA